MSWLSDTTANRTKKSYFNGFVDISGGDLHVRHGNSSIDGSLNVGDNVGIKTSSAPSMSLDISATDGIRIPVGNDAQRPVQNNDTNAAVYEGTMRFNTDTAEFEGYSGGVWRGIGGSGSSGVTNDEGTATIVATNTAATFPDALVFEAGGQRRMVVGGDGKVLIEGDLSMSGTLDVANFFVESTVANKIIASEYLSVSGTSSVVDEHPGVGVRVGNKAHNSGQHPTFQLVSDISDGAHLDFLNNNLSDGENNYHGRLEFKHGSGDSTQGWFMSFSDTIANDISDDLYQFRPDEMHSRKPITLTETGAGTAASVTGGSITLSHTTNDGSGKNSIVFKSASNGTDYGYIQYEDDDGLDGASDENGLLTIGIQNDYARYGATHAERIKFDVAGASAYLESRANSTGGNKGSAFTPGAVFYSGIHADAYSLDTNWNRTLTAYGSTADQDRSAIYQLFDNAHDSDHDLAFTGMNAPGGSTVDGSSKPYGYMLRSRSDGYIAYQTGWSENTTNGYGLALGVNALPGRYYDFAVGGKSHFGNDVTVTGDLTVDGSINFTGDFIKTDTIVRITEQVDVSNDGTGPAMRVTQHGDQPVAEFYDDATLAMVVKNGGDVSLAGNLTVDGAGMFTGSTDINYTTAPSGVYLGNNGSVGNQDSIIQMTSTGDYSVIDFTSSGATSADADREGRIRFANGNHSTNPYQLSFTPRDTNSAALTLKAVASRSIDAVVDGMLTLNGGIASSVRDYESSDYWDASLAGGNDYRSAWPDGRSAAYLYVDNGFTSAADLLLTGHIGGGGGILSYGYNLYSKGAVQAGVTDQGLCIQTSYNGSQNFRLGLGARPGTYQFLTTGDVKVGGKLDVDGSLNVTDDASIDGTLALNEAGAGTAASATGGTITLSHTTSDGTGKNSIVFKSASDSGSDYGYIEYHDDGAGGSDTQNGLLTIGVKNDTTTWDTGITHADQIHFIVADASAALQPRANASGGNPGTLFILNATWYRGLYADAFDLNDYWNISLTAYGSTADQNRSALYQYFDNAHNSDYDLAFTGMNAPTGSSVDGSSKPYGYMLRSRSDGYIAYQTEWLDGVYDAKGLALGVNALPGRYYDFAVGGKSHFGNTLTITETGAGTAASATGGSITLSHATSDGTGKNSIVFKSTSNPDSDFGYIQYEDDDGLDSTSPENGLLTIGIQNDTTRYGGTTTGHAERIKFDIAGASAYLESRANSTGGSVGAVFTTNYVNHVGLHADVFPLDTLWNRTLTAYSSTADQNRSALYLLFDNAHDSNDDLAFTGMNAPGGSTVDGSSKPYGYMLRSRSDGYIAYQTGWLDGVYDDKGLALGVNALPGRYYDFAVGGKSHFGNTLTITETGTGTAAGHSSGSILLKRSSHNGRSSIVFDSVNSGDDFAYIEFQDEGGSGTGSANGQLTIGVQNDTSDSQKERIRFDIAGAYAYLLTHDDGAGGNLGSHFSVDAISHQGIDPRAFNLNTFWGKTLDYYDTVNNTDRYTMYQYFSHTQDSIHDMALVGYNAGAGSNVNPDGNFSYGYMYRSKNAPNKFIAFQTRGLQYSDNDSVDGMRLGVNAVPGYTYDFAVGGKSHFGNDVDMCGNLTVDGSMSIGYWNSPTYATVNGLLTMKMGISSSVRDYESADYWNASLNGGNDYRTWGDKRTAAYLYVDNGSNSGSDLLLTGHVNGGSGNMSYGYNLYSKGAVQAGVTDQGLCIQTQYDGSYNFRLGLGYRPGTYQFLTTGDVKVGGKLDMDGTLNISESGAGTAASVTDGTLTLSHTTSDGTGKNSIVFKSASNGTDYGYIQYNDNGGLDDASDENGLLTIGVQNDPNKHGITPTNAERIKFDIAGASAYLDAKANSTGGSVGAVFTTNYVNHVGLHADVFPLDTLWNRTLTAYDSTVEQNRSALYLLFDNAHHSDDDLAFTGMNAPGGSTVDGSSKPYGYMLRSRSDGYIAYQTRWLEQPYSEGGLALGVNALPGRYYDFAVGGKSHFGNDVIVTGSVTESSDERLKTDIEPIDGALDKISRLRGVSYRRRKDYDASSIKHIGMIAQDMQREFPELVETVSVDTDNDGVTEKYYGIKYTSFTAPLVEAVKELKTKNDALETKCSTLETTHNALVAEHNTLRSEVETLKQQNTDILQRLAALEGNA